MVAECSSSSALDDILRNVLLPWLAAFRELGFGDYGREGVWDFSDAGDGLVVGD